MALAAKTKINTVLFDFDGTLADTDRLIVDSWQHTYRTFDGRERPVEAIMATLGEPLVVTLKKTLPHADTAEAMATYRDFQIDRFEDMIAVFPGMDDLPKTLKAQGYKLGIVTSRLTRTTMRGLDVLGVRACFDTVVTADDTAKHKPHPEPILTALARLGAAPEESIMIGDSTFDIHCAKNAGVRSVLVGWTRALPPAERRGKNAPDFVIATAEELLDVLAQID